MKTSYLRFGFFVSLSALTQPLISTALNAQTLDTVIFGNTTSETSHSLTTDFPAVTPSADIPAGYNQPSNPSNTPPSSIVTSAPGPSGTSLTARTLGPRTPYADVYGGEMVFTMVVDPVKQNYFTVKFWGSDPCAVSAPLFVLNCNGYEVGWRHVPGPQNTDNVEMLWNTESPLQAWFPGRFIYRTAMLPLNLTTGQTSVTLKIRSLGPIYYDASGVYFGNYQKLMSENSLAIYSGYTHIGGYFDFTAETQGTAPTPAGPPTLTQTAEMTTWENQLNSENSHLLLLAPASFTPSDIDFLAQSYGVVFPSGSTVANNAYDDPAALSQVIAAIDAIVTGYSANTEPADGWSGVSGWGGAYGPMGDAIRLLWPQINTGTTMSTEVAYGGTLGTMTRTQAWSAALRASVDYGRYNQNGISN